MDQETQYLTKEKYKELQDELNHLITIRRKEVAEHLEYAKKLGDLSENAEYHEAREEQAGLEDRIKHIEHILKTAQILNDRHTDVASIGSTIKIQKSGESETRSFMIVGSEEVDTATGKISNLSPIGTSIIGKKKGESFSVKTPKGDIVYTLVNLE